MLVNPEPLNIPEADIGRQAVSSLGGYIYQLYQTVAAWLKLGDNDILAIEVAEDYCILIGNLVKQVQTKDTEKSGNVTLRSEAVLKLIDSHIRLLQENPKSKVRSVFLTTSDAGHEQSISFPNAVTGLEYWNNCAGSTLDIEPLTKILHQLNLSEGTKKYLQNTPTEVLKEQLIDSINWLYGAPHLESVQKSIRDNLVLLGHNRAIPAKDAERVEHSLLAKLINIIAYSKDRKVTKPDLIRIFDGCTTSSWPNSFIEKLINQSFQVPNISHSVLSSANPICKVSSIPLPPRMAQREDLVKDITAICSQVRCLWIYGGTGLGKTKLSLLAAQNNAGSWYFVDLQKCSAQDIRDRLSKMALIIEQQKVSGIILDDYPFVHISSSLMSLTQLVSIANANSVPVVITSSQRPLAEVESHIGQNDLRMMQVPYMTENDIASLITSAGGNPKIWTGCVLVRAGNGHPRMVDAYISSLGRQGWPQEKLADYFLGEQPEEIQIQHSETLTKLMSELPHDAQHLLYRLSHCFGVFDTELAFAIAAAEPALNRPNELIHQLLGPWIEYRGADKLVVSPLVNEPGKRNLSKAEQSSVRNAVVANLVERNPFPGEQLSQLLFMSFAEQNESGLRWFVGAMLQHIVTGQELFAHLAQEVSIFASFTLNRPLCNSNSELSAMLRIVQFFVALEIAPTKANAIFDKAVEECLKIEDKVISSTLLLLLIGKVLMRRDGILAPRQWLPLLADMPELLEHSGPAGEGLTKLFSDNKNEQDWTPDQFLFACQATALPNIDSLIGLFEALNELEPSRRDHLLDAFNDELDGKRLMFSMPWVNESKSGSVDGFAAAFKYTRITQIATAWGKADLEIYGISNQAGLLTDYADGSQQALAVTEAALLKYPDSDVLLHRKLAILYKQKKYKEALEVFLNPLDAYKDDPLERAYVLRCAGVCAFHIGDLSSASTYFLEAFSCINPSAGAPKGFATGLLADCALVEFLKGNYEKAIRLCAQVLTLCDQLDPEAGKQQRYCIIVVGHLINCLYNASQYPNPCAQKLQIEPGNCSNPDPPAEILDRPLAPKIARWYLLTACELNLGVNAGTETYLSSMTKSGAYFPFEILLSDSRITTSAKTGNIRSFIEALRHHLAVISIPTEHGDAINPLTPIQVTVIPVDLSSLNDAKLFDAFAEPILAFACFALVRNTPQDIQKLVKTLEPQLPPKSDAQNFVQTLITDCSWPHRIKLQCQVADSIAAIRDPSQVLPLDTMSKVTTYLWSWLQRTAFQKYLENDMTEFIANLWHKAIVQNPEHPNAKAIETVLNGQHKGIVKLAEIIIAGPRVLDKSVYVDVQNWISRNS